MLDLDFDLQNPRIIDVNKAYLQEPCSMRPKQYTCRPLPGGSGEMSFVITSSPCALGVQEFLEREMNLSHTPRTSILEFDLIIVMIGAWEIGREWDCRGDGLIDRNERMKVLVETCHRFTQQTKIPIIWRTSGYGGFLNPSVIANHEARVAEMNDAAMDAIDSFGDQTFVSYIHWGGAVRDRSFGSHRIAGDLKYHYGVEPRRVLVQMLTNHLVDRGLLGCQ